MSASTRILIVDDHECVREGLRLLLAEEPGLQIVGEAASGEEAVELSRALHPDLVLMDLMMPGIGGIEAIRRLRQATPRPQVLVLTSYSSEMNVNEALEAGASGYLLKDVLKGHLLQAIAEAREAEPPFQPGPGAQPL
jgi:DNA-binding NarL/FixJ family response regulator